MILYNDEIYRTFNEAMTQLNSDYSYVPDDFIPDIAEREFQYIDAKLGEMLEPLLES